MYVSYESFGEFCALRRGLRLDYEALASEPLRLAEPLFWQHDLYEHWAVRGVALWRKVTKGGSESFCARRASERAHALLAVVAAYARLQLGLASLLDLPRAMTDTAEVQGLLVQSVGDHYDLSAWDEILDDSFFENGEDFVPVDRVLATAMAAHPRLGEASGLAQLPVDLLRALWEL